jgi:hypothetical protein
VRAAKPPIGSESARKGAFIAYASGVVRDTKTSLEWFADPDWYKTWYEASSWVKSLAIDGGGWRMPTIEELKTLYQEQEGRGKYNPPLLITKEVWAGWAWSEEIKGSPNAGAVAFGFTNPGHYWFHRERELRAFAVRSR